MNQKIVINATIRTVGPLSIKMPVAEGGRENGFDNFPVMTRGVDEAGNKLQTGYLPATTLRGFLRRAVTLRNMRSAAEASSTDTVMLARKAAAARAARTRCSDDRIEATPAESATAHSASVNSSEMETDDSRARACSTSVTGPSRSMS